MPKKTEKKPHSFVGALDMDKPNTGTTAQALKTESQEKKKYLAVRVLPEVSKQLHQIAINENSSIQALLGEEAIDMIFHSRGLPTIASKQPK